MDKSIWLSNILTMIEEISDKHYQEEVWLKGVGNEESSFNEAICGLFDDYDFDGFLDEYSTENYLNKLKIEKLKLFRDKLNQYLLNIDDNLCTKDLLADPEWHNIQASASQVLKVINSCP